MRVRFTANEVTGTKFPQFWAILGRVRGNGENEDSFAPWKTPGSFDTDEAF